MRRIHYKQIPLLKGRTDASLLRSLKGLKEMSDAGTRRRDKPQGVCGEGLVREFRRVEVRWAQNAQG